MGPYVAPTRTGVRAAADPPSPLSPSSCDGTQQSASGVGAECLRDTGHEPLSPPSTSSLYDLYGVVHHVGAMGGGHYVTTARDRKGCTVAAPAAAASRNASSSDLGNLAGKSSDNGNDIGNVNSNHDGSNSNSSSITAAPGGKWWCFNDDAVTPVANPHEVCSASAYVLFYMRRDMWGKDVNQIFEQSTGMSAEQLVSAMPTPDSTPLADDGADGEQNVHSQQEQGTAKDSDEDSRFGRNAYQTRSPSSRRTMNDDGSPLRTKTPPASAVKIPTSMRKSPVKSRELEQKLHPRASFNSTATDDSSSCVTA